LKSWQSQSDGHAPIQKRLLHGTHFAVQFGLTVAYAIVESVMRCDAVLGSGAFSLANFVGASERCDPKVEPPAALKPATLESALEPTTLKSALEPTTLKSALEPTTLKSALEPAPLKSALEPATEIEPAKVEARITEERRRLRCRRGGNAGAGRVCLAS
jgi:hypothetical protein